MPALAAAGHDSYAFSLRGQGTSQLCASQQPAAAAAGDAQDIQQPSSSSNSSSSSSSKPFAHGVPLALNVADIAAFIRSRNFSTPPVLVGHSLGGMFVQEYLHQLHRQQQQQQQQHASLPLTAAADPSSGSSSSSGAAFPHLSEPVPSLAGAVLLASACAGTVMSFGQFIADVGLPEFLYQMYIVFSCAHLNDIGTAR
jgi:pimeloyl-ACP methyl ester carboxylesterase